MPCPDVSHCYPGVNCIMNNSSSESAYITCGECPKGFIGDGIRCRPSCSRCDESSEVCIGPDMCQGEKSALKVSAGIDNYFSAKCFPPCQNGGKCTRSGKCKCPGNFSGFFCHESQIPRLEKGLRKGCMKKPCENGGTCKISSGKCSCPPGYKGSRCQKSKLMERKYPSSMFSDSGMSKSHCYSQFRIFASTSSSDEQM